MEMVLKILVTGAAGFIGRALVRMLADTEHEIFVVVRNWEQAERAGFERGFTVLQSELGSPEACNAICRGKDVVIHMAGLAHANGDVITHRRLTLEPVRRMAEASVRQGVRQFIYLSSVKAQWPDHSAYGKVRSEAEHLLLTLFRNGLLNVCILRPCMVYGVEMKGNLRQLLKLFSWKWLPFTISSEAKFGLISRQDCCRAIVGAVVNDKLAGKCWSLNDGQLYTLNDITGMVRKRLGYSMPAFVIPKRLIYTCAWLSEKLSPLTGWGFGIGTCRTIFEENFEADDSFGKISGFNPVDRFEQQLPELLAALGNRPDSAE
jgi:nucleoside-diphosphate-sugar epimerase